MDCYPSHCPGRLRNASRYHEPYLKNVRQSAAFGIMPWLVYKRLKRGMLDPNESFLRVSQRSGFHDPGRRYHRQYWNLKSPLSDLLENFHAVTSKSDLAIPSGHSGHFIERRCLFILGPDLNNTVLTEPGQRLSILDKDVMSMLKDGFGSKRFKDILRRKRANLAASLKILEQISEKYQCIRSMESPREVSDLPDWFRRRSEALCDESIPSWPYSKLEIVKGIRQIGDAYELDTLLDNLSRAFNEAYNENVAMTVQLEGSKGSAAPHAEPVISVPESSSRKGRAQGSDAQHPWKGISDDSYKESLIPRKRKSIEDSRKREAQHHKPGKRHRTEYSNRPDHESNYGGPSNPILIDTFQ